MPDLTPPANRLFDLGLVETSTAETGAVFDFECLRCVVGWAEMVGTSKTDGLFPDLWEEDALMRYGEETF